MVVNETSKDSTEYAVAVITIAANRTLSALESIEAGTNQKEER
jgi:hypothetical protein